MLTNIMYMLLCYTFVPPWSLTATVDGDETIWSPISHCNHNEKDFERWKTLQFTVFFNGSDSDLAKRWFTRYTRDTGFSWIVQIMYQHVWAKSER